MSISIEEDDFVILARPSVGVRLLCIFILSVIIAVLRWRGLLQINTSYIGGFEQDPGLYVWLSKHAATKLFSLPWFETSAFYPYGKTLAWSDNFIFPGLIYGLIHLIANSDAFAYNSILLLTQFLNGFITFELIFGLTEDALSSIFAGILALCLLSFEGQLGHPQLQFFFFFPAGILSVLNFLRTPKAVNSARLGLLLFITFVTTVYYALFLVLLYLSLFLSLFIIHPRLFNKKILSNLVTGGILGALPIIPFIIPYLQIKDIFGSRELFEAYYFSATSLSLITPSATTYFFSNFINLCHVEARAFVGFSILLLAVLALRRTFEPSGTRRSFLCFLVSLTLLLIFSALPGNQWLRYSSAACLWIGLLSFIYGLKSLGEEERRYDSHILTNRNILGALLFSSLVFFLTSLGPLGNPVKDHFAPGLYSLLFYLIPGFNALRAIGRASMIATYLLVLVYYLFLSHFRTKQNLHPLLFALLLCAPLVENYSKIYPLDLPIPEPPLIHTIQNLPSSQALIALPFANNLDATGNINSWSDFSRLQIYYMNWLQNSHVALVNGYSGQESKLMKDLPRRVKNFPDDRSLQELYSIAGLRYIAIFPHLMPKFNSQIFEGLLSIYPETLKLLEKDSEGNYLLELDGETTLTSDFILRVPGRSQDVTLKLSTTKDCQEEETKLVIKDSESINSTPFATLRLPSKLPPTWMNISLNENPDPRIIRLGFETKGCPIKLGGSRVSTK